jgi:hypothetical protein
MLNHQVQLSKLVQLSYPQEGEIEMEGKVLERQGGRICRRLSVPCGIVQACDP